MIEIMVQPSRGKCKSLILYLLVLTVSLLASQTYYIYSVLDNPAHTTSQHNLKIADRFPNKLSIDNGLQALDVELEIIDEDEFSYETQLKHPFDSLQLYGDDHVATETPLNPLPLELQVNNGTPNSSHDIAVNYISRWNVYREKAVPFPGVSTRIEDFIGKSAGSVHVSPPTMAPFKSILEKRYHAIRLFKKRPLILGVDVDAAQRPIETIEKWIDNMTVHELDKVIICLVVKNHDQQTESALNRRFRGLVQKGNMEILKRTQSKPDLGMLLRYSQQKHGYLLYMSLDMVVVRSFVSEVGWWLDSHYAHCQDWTALAFASTTPLNDQTQLSREQVDPHLLGYVFNMNTVDSLLGFLEREQFQDPLHGIQTFLDKTDIADNKIYIHHPPVLLHKTLAGKLVDVEHYPGYQHHVQLNMMQPSLTDTTTNFLKQHRLVFGIPTVYRKTSSYLPRTIYELLSNVPLSFMPYITFVVLNCNVPATDNHDITLIRTRFADAISRGNLIIIEYSDLHPFLKTPLRQTWNDPPDRVFWRSKQVLDFTYLMEFSIHFADYYVQLEDDILVTKNYVEKMISWMERFYAERNDWFMLSFYHAQDFKDHQSYPPVDFYGFIGQLFRSRDLPGVINFFRKQFNESPCDWLLRDYLTSQNNDTAATKNIFVHTPSLFQHVGTVSSLQGKMQSVISANFDKSKDIFTAGMGPFLLTSSVESSRTSEKRTEIFIAIRVTDRPEMFLKITLRLLFLALSNADKSYFKIVLFDIGSKERKNPNIAFVERNYQSLIVQGTLSVETVNTSPSSLDAELRDYIQILNHLKSRQYALLLDDDITFRSNFLQDVDFFLQTQLTSDTKDFLALYYPHVAPKMTKSLSGLLFSSQKVPEIISAIESMAAMKSRNEIYEILTGSSPPDDKTALKIFKHDAFLFQNIGT